METVECTDCKSVMGLVMKTPRWAIYKCFSCRHVMGCLNGELEGTEREDADAEMDLHASTIMNDEMTDIRNRLASTSPDELNRFFKRKV